MYIYTHTHIYEVAGINVNMMPQRLLNSSQLLSSHFLCNRLRFLTQTHYIFH